MDQSLDLSTYALPGLSRSRQQMSQAQATAFEISEWLHLSGREGQAELHSSERGAYERGILHGLGSAGPSELGDDDSQSPSTLSLGGRYPNTRSAQLLFRGPASPQLEAGSSKVVAGPARTTRSSSRRQGQTPLRASQPCVDESVPEAALNLMCLAFPSGGSKPGSFAGSFSPSMLAAEFSGAEDEDEPDVRGASTSTPLTYHRHFPLDSFGAPGTGVIPGDVLPHTFRNRSRGNSITSSIGTTASISTSRTQQYRPHRPARTQRDGERSRAASESFSLGGRPVPGGSSRFPYLESPDTSTEADKTSIGGADDDGASSQGSQRRAGKGKASSTRTRSNSLASSVAPSAAKRHKSNSTSSALDVPRTPRPAPPALPVFTRRTFPAAVEQHPTFPRLYRNFPVSSAFEPTNILVSGGDCPVPTLDLPALASWSKTPEPFNLYQHRFTRGLLNDKAAACPICIEPVERGGEGIEKFFKLKNSSYVYHLSNYHGISNSTGLPLSPPLAFRQVALKKGTGSRAEMTEGLCHCCRKWVPMLSVKNVDAVVLELLWWKHAKPCHTSTIKGETDYFIQDDVYNLVTGAHPAAH